MQLQKTLKLMCVTGFGIVASSPAALALTDFTATVTPGPASAQPTVTNGFTFESSAGNSGTNNGLNGNNPDSDGTVYSLSSQMGGHYAAYNYGAGGAGGITGSQFAQFDSIFLARNVNNGTGRGTPIFLISMSTSGGGPTGVGISLNMINAPDDSYHYQLVQFSDNSQTSILAGFDHQFAVDATPDHQDATLNHAILSLDATGRAKLLFDADISDGDSPVEVFNQVLTPFAGGSANVQSRAWFGAGNIVQPVAANARAHVWFQTTTLSATSAVPEPASIGLLAVAGVIGGVRRRRRV